MFGLLPTFPYVFKYRDDAGRFAKQPEPPQPIVYPNHNNYALRMPLSVGVAAAVQDGINPSVRRCRIGKITLKQSDARS